MSDASAPPQATTLDGAAASDGCACPIHQGGSVPTLPLGVPFASRVSVRPIDRKVAAPIYRQHHSYRPSVPPTNPTLAHHGVFFDDALVGAITYSYPLLSESCGYSGGEIAEVSRICLGVEMPNLASAALARSQDRFIETQACRAGIRALLTFIHGEYEGSMLKALQDKGWEFTGISEGKPPGNRQTEAIHFVSKQRWLYRIDRETPEQAQLEVFGDD